MVITPPVAWSGLLRLKSLSSRGLNACAHWCSVGRGYACVVHHRSGFFDGDSGLHRCCYGCESDIVCGYAGGCPLVSRFFGRFVFPFSFLSKYSENYSRRKQIHTAQFSSSPLCPSVKSLVQRVRLSRSSCMIVAESRYSSSSRPSRSAIALSKACFASLHAMSGDARIS